jgi:hypothetical protein
MTKFDCFIKMEQRLHQTTMSGRKFVVTVAPTQLVYRISIKRHFTVDF